MKVTTPDLPLWERELDAAAGPDHIGGEEAARSLDTNDYPKLTYSDQIVLTGSIIGGAWSRLRRRATI